MLPSGESSLRRFILATMLLYGDSSLRRCILPGKLPPAAALFAGFFLPMIMPLARPGPPIGIFQSGTTMIQHVGRRDEYRPGWMSSVWAVPASAGFRQQRRDMIHAAGFRWRRPPCLRFRRRGRAPLGPRKRRTGGVGLGRGGTGSAGILRVWWRGTGSAGLGARVWERGLPGRTVRGHPVRLS